MTWVVVVDPRDRRREEVDIEVDYPNPMVGDVLLDGRIIVHVMEDDDDDFVALDLFDDP
ncbi:MAG: hypothetical protein PHH09_01330 [Methanoregulaceae archaeon]|nr:hypothetical protein [Methanoregulaceae archaeon]MDD5047552.1 hypothetical protein [Methanoregulaceae archaeon]